jgi:hypothetical protein
MYLLTFRRGTLVHMETGSYGMYPPSRKLEQGREFSPPHSRRS